MQVTKKRIASLTKTKIFHFYPNQSLLKPVFKSHYYISQVVSQLSINKKIALGYAVALGVAILGTATGFTLGDYQQRQAMIEKEQAFNELQLLYSLQINLLETQNHQNNLMVLQDLKHWQREYIELQEHTTQLKHLWSQLKTYASSQRYAHGNHTEGIPEFLKTYAGIPEAYRQNITAKLIHGKLSISQQQDIDLAKKQLLDLANSSYNKLYQLSQALERVISGSYEDLQNAEEALLDTYKLREQIISLSMLLSVAIAILLASYTSRTIASPLQAVTSIAQQVTQESNFNLQAPVTTADEVGILATSLNQLIQKVNTLLAEQKAESSRQLIQSEKMSSLGRMLAGVAHEINNPVNFIYGNIQHTTAYFQDILDLLEAYESKASDDEIQAKSAEIDLEFLKEDLPNLLQSMQVGATRAREIVLSLKNFSRLDENTIHPIDIHACIDSTLLILNTRIKRGIKIILNYGTLPNIDGYAGSLYQVFMNILSNAMDALEEQTEIDKPKEIIITTQRLDEAWVLVKITDNGCGIPQEYQQKIFESFFTTKPVGIGTGLGLSISYQIVVEKHGGRLTCESEVGKGTTFAIALPIKQ